MLYLSQTDLESLNLSINEIVDDLDALILAKSKPGVWAAPKAAITTGDGRYMMATVSAADNPPFMAVKSVLVNPDNPQSGLAAINSSVTLMSSQTGVPVAVMDGNWITGIRTAAASAVAAKYLATPESAVIAFVGCGVQAKSHLEVFSALYPLQSIRVIGRGEKNKQAVCDQAEAMGFTALADGSPEELVADADIIVSSLPITSTVAPFVDARWLKAGAFIASTDLSIPWVSDGMKELDMIFIDDLEQEASMPDAMVNPNWVSGDIHDLVNQRADGRTSSDQKTAFIFRAVPLGDLSLSVLAYQRAVELNVGSSIS